MSDADNRHPYQPHPEHGWQPLPQGGEYESEATAFVQLPEGFTSGVYGGGSPRYGTPGPEPLAAPGHGYTPPASFTPHEPTPPAAGTDPSATGQWTMPFADPSAGYADPSAGYPAQAEYAAHHGAAEGYHGDAPEAARPWHGDPVDWPVAGSPEAGNPGTWSVPAAADDGLEESGEYLVGDDGLTGHPAPADGHPGHHGQPGHSGQPGHPGHPAHTGHHGHPGPAGTGDATGYQGGGYPGAGAYDGAGNPGDAGEAAGTGHWNFTTGLTATGGAETHTAPPHDASHGGAAPAHFGGAADDPYAHEHGLPGRGAEPAAERPGGTGPSGGDPYGTGAGVPHGAAGGATGHWSLPADALAQWPPAGDTAQPSHDGGRHQEPADRPDGAADAPGGADDWTVPAAADEQPEDSGEFASTDADGHVTPAAPGADGRADAVPQHGEHTGRTDVGGLTDLGGLTDVGGLTDLGGLTDVGGLTDLDGLADPRGAGHGGESPGTDAHAGADGRVGADAHAGAHETPGADEHAEAADNPADIPAENPGEDRSGTAEATDGGSEGDTGSGSDSGSDDESGILAGDAEGPFGAEVAGEAGVAGAPEAEAFDEHPAASYVLRVNGIDRPVTDAWIGESLLYVLRERLGLAGAKDGCSQGECGACSVQVDGRLVASCLVPAATTAGSEVRTVEGLAENGEPSDVQRALTASGAVQCGFCVPGMAMTVHDLLEGNHAPSELETRKALCGNLCRCSGYRGVLDAVDQVVKARAESAEAAYGPADDDADGAPPADTARIPHQAGPADPMGQAPHDQDPHTGGSA
ncbi:Aerobic-type carbon monoxide dehydrogenase, small subunit, CoxS/CutS family [Streptomyces sp. 2112.3]|uniref:2Fe-2S iron-sulfur cluster-binding protein n=1 Tax=Streptomyces sp. 2112.3 TaxID=1881023 RepID=UPI0008968156|nr:2Fe-2S iron-sulfur cluster-binding protein [Streptomyces sp. 2112.3]SEE94028.1 Aerobic-type carbon monoxide dehydrogenase, small subunit, CoxS/CutS family [Streptomyces sp. 2112.3]